MYVYSIRQHNIFLSKMMTIHEVTSVHTICIEMFRITYPWSLLFYMYKLVVLVVHTLSNFSFRFQPNM